MNNHIQWKPIRLNSRISNYQIGNNGSIINGKGDILSPYWLNSGYLAIKLSDNGIKYHFLIHRLVAEYFIPNPENKPQVNHKDGNKGNNWDWNLEWATQPENMQHAARSELLNPKIGVENPFAIHTENQIREVCSMVSSGRFNQQEISNATGVTINTIKNIIYGKKWKHISSQYDFSKYNSGKLPRWSDETKAAIHVYHQNGCANPSDILKMIGEPDIDPYRQRIYRMLCRDKSSTTNDLWVVFDFTSNLN